jgi:hypothetical protein
MERVRLTEAGTRHAGLARRGAACPADAVLALQRMAGNRAVTQLLRCKDKDKKKKKTPRQVQAEQMAQKSAKNQAPIEFKNLPETAQAALTQILSGNDGPYLRPDGGRHSTDPDSGLPKGPGIGVREYHTLPYNESYRLVVRTKGKEKSAYWDPKHTGGTYTYHRIENAPFPAAAPAPAPVAPAPAPVVVPAAAAPVPVAVPVAAAPEPLKDNWDD